MVMQVGTMMMYIPVPLSSLLTGCNILTDHQLGFRQKHATIHAILLLIDKVAKAIDNKSNMVGYFHHS